MKLTIFCLLAFCAFEIVHGDVNKALDLMYAHSAQQIGTFTTPAETKILACLDAAEKKGKDVEDCKNNFKVPLQDIVPSMQTEMQKCVDDARKSGKLKDADKCCTGKVNSLKSKVNSLVTEAKACMHRSGYSTCK